MTNPRSPTTVGRFELEGLLGEGAFGAVHRAWDPQLQRPVALKVPRSGTLSERADVERFIREARAAARLRHPHIVAVYEAGCVGSTHYIASAYVAGRTLRQELKQGRRYSAAEAAQLIAQLARALDYAHSQGVIHRDLKPANVMLDEQGEPHLLDFGLAQHTAGDGLRTLEGIVLGTPAYMSPEQAQGQGHLADGRSDLWSLGVMLYELLTGRRPFEGNDTEIMMAIRTQEPARLRSVDRLIPRDLETIALKCLAKMPGERYATCADLAAELERWLRGEPIAARPIGPAERAWRWTRRKPVVAALTYMVSSLLVALTVGSLLVANNLSDSRNSVHEALAEAHEQRTVALRHAEATRANLEQWQRKHQQRQRIETEREGHEQARSSFEQQALQAGKQAQQFAQTAVAEEAAIAEAVRDTRRAKESLDQSLVARSEARRKALATLNLSEYVDRIRQARQRWAAGRPDEMHEYLDACSPEYRSWEWGYLKYVATHRKDHAWRQSRAGESIAQMRFSAYGETLFVTHHPSQEILLFDTATGRHRPGQGVREPLVSLTGRKRRGGDYVYTVLLQDPEAPSETPMRFQVQLSGTVRDARWLDVLNANLSYYARSPDSYARSRDGRALALVVPMEALEGQQPWVRALVVIDTETGATRFVLPVLSSADGNSRGSAAVHFSSDGKWVCVDATRSVWKPTTSSKWEEESIVRVWDAATGQEAQEPMQALRPQLPGLTRYSADFKRHVQVAAPYRTRSGELRAGRARLLDTESGFEVMALDLPPLVEPAQLENPSEPLRPLHFAFSPDGKWLAGYSSGPETQLIVVWEARWESP